MTSNEPPAFPTLAEVNNREIVVADGMTLRDYFAAKALQAVLQMDRNDTYFGDAEQAYIIADAMLAERSKP